MTQSIPQQLIAITAQLVEKLERQPYIEPTLTVSASDTKPFQIYWYSRDVNDDVRFAGSSAQEVLHLASRHVHHMPDPETAALQNFQKSLAQLIDKAPPQIDTTLLSEFNQHIFENLLTHQQAGAL